MNDDMNDKAIEIEASTLVPSPVTVRVPPCSIRAPSAPIRSYSFHARPQPRSRRDAVLSEMRARFVYCDGLPTISRRSQQASNASRPALALISHSPLQKRRRYAAGP